VRGSLRLDEGILQAGEYKEIRLPDRLLEDKPGSLLPEAVFRLKICEKAGPTPNDPQTLKELTFAFLPYLALSVILLEPLR